MQIVATEEAGLSLQLFARPVSHRKADGRQLCGNCYWPDSE